MESTTPKTRRRVRSVVVAALVVVLLGAAWYVARSTAQESASAGGPGAAGNSQVASEGTDHVMASVVGQTRLWKGDPQAPVTIVEFADFQ